MYRKSVTKQGYMSSDPCFPVSISESMVSRLTSSIDSIVTWSSLPTLDVDKFSGDPCEYS